MAKYINLTTYRASPSQRELGVIDINGNIASALSELLSFHSAPQKGEMLVKANSIADIAYNLSVENETPNVLINAKAFFIPTLVAALQSRGLVPFYTFAQRSTTVKDGTVLEKTYIHKNIVECSPEI
ncbi:hypothetical protein P7V44_07275 [Providencia sp. CRE-3FA-0001]|uniref:Uncharacterized protein n=1 Tax=Providencia huashanensis TaxID=3037798 RepID=A0AA42FG73_9GAMM|nr:hypothetical protein [Providencia sp. CRE-3FA-0001]MDG4696039.1 hypothetical protein [Providencia sp. CRE-3FA-0001]